MKKNRRRNRQGSRPCHGQSQPASKCDPKLREIAERFPVLKRDAEANLVLHAIMRRDVRELEAAFAAMYGFQTFRGDVESGLRPISKVGILGLNFIENFRDKHGYWPSPREYREFMGKNVEVVGWTPEQFEEYCRANLRATMEDILGRGGPDLDQLR